MKPIKESIVGMELLQNFYYVKKKLDIKCSGIRSTHVLLCLALIHFNLNALLCNIFFHETAQSLAKFIVVLLLQEVYIL